MGICTVLDSNPSIATARADGMYYITKVDESMYLVECAGGRVEMFDTFKEAKQFLESL